MKLMSINITVELPDGIQPENATVLVNKKVDEKPNTVPAKNKNAKFRRWTKKEIKFLIENYESMTCAEIAEKLGRNENQIGNKIYFLRKQGKISQKKKRGKSPDILKNPNDNGNPNALTCADCPKADKEMGNTVFCRVDKIRKPADTPMCQEMIETLNEVQP